MDEYHGGGLLQIFFYRSSLTYPYPFLQDLTTLISRRTTQLTSSIEREMEHELHKNNSAPSDPQLLKCGDLDASIVSQRVHDFLSRESSFEGAETGFEDQHFSSQTSDSGVSLDVNKLLGLVTSPSSASTLPLSNSSGEAAALSMGSSFASRIKTSGNPSDFIASSADGFDSDDEILCPLSPHNLPNDDDHAGDEDEDVDEARGDDEQAEEIDDSEDSVEMSDPADLSHITKSDARLIRSVIRQTDEELSQAQVCLSFTFKVHSLILSFFLSLFAQLSLRSDIPPDSSLPSSSISAFSSEASSASSPDADSDSVHFDYSVVRNILASYEAQEGEPGPALSLLLSLQIDPPLRKPQSTSS